LIKCVEASQAAAAAEANARSQLQQELCESCEQAAALAAEVEEREKAGATENERLRTLLAEATQEVQAASEGVMLEYYLIACKMHD
jgi:hypothetical protein